MSEDMNITLPTMDFLKLKEETMGEIYVMNNNGSVMDGQQMAYVTEQGEVEVCYPVYDLESQQFLMNINGRLETMKASDQKIVSANLSQDGNFEIVHPQHIPEVTLNNHKEVISSFQTNKPEDSTANDICNNEIDNAESVIQVMLDDDQCRTLEQKGRVLLEQDSRFFLLDNVGLQEITQRDDFIEQLREEHLSLCQNKETDSEILPAPIHTYGDTIPDLQMNQEEKINPLMDPFIEIVEQNSEVEPSEKDLNVEDYNMETDVKDETLKACQSNEVNDIMETEDTDEKEHEISDHSSNYGDVDKDSEQVCSEEGGTDKTETSNERNLEPIITVSMDYVVKELPPKLYIGQSYDGKNIYARLRSIIPAAKNTSQPVQIQNRRKSQTKTYTSPNSKPAKLNTDKTPTSLVKKCLNSKPNRIKMVNQDEKNLLTSKLIDEVMSSDPEDISYLLAALWFTDFSTCGLDDHLTLIEKTVDSLMQLVSVKKLIVGHNVIVTKVVKSENGEVNVPFVVTGYISDFSGHDREENWRFIYIPDLLTENNKELIQEYQMSHGDSKGKQIIRSDPSNKLLHIAIVESPGDQTRTNKHNTNVLVVFKSLKKLAQELKQHNCFSQSVLLSGSRPVRFKGSSLIACAACGATFTSEGELDKHQEIHKFEDKNKEPSELIEEDNGLKIVENQKIMFNEQQCNKMFVCYYCKKVFTRCSNLQRHMSIHIGPKVPPADTSSEQKKHNETQEPKEMPEQKKGVFTCNMCTCSYFYASTLTRHIMTCHIDSKKKNADLLGEFK